MKLNFTKSTRTLPIHLEDKWVNQIDEFLTDLGWPIKNHNLNGLRTMLRDWYQTKGASFEERFKDIPGYNEFRIFETIDEKREINPGVIDRTISQIRNLLKVFLVPAKYAGHWDNNELNAIVNVLASKKRYLSYLPKGTTLPDGRTDDDVLRDYNHWSEILEKFTRESAYFGGGYYTCQSYELFSEMHNIIRIFSRIQDETLSGDDAEKIIVKIPEIKGIREGVATRKAFRKVLEHFKCFEKIDGLETLYAQYADAICPRIFKRDFICSVNPIDFLTMSRAKNWTSCHHPNPWKKDWLIDESECSSHTLEYRSCYCAGCFSYMLDDCSVVTYTVSKLPSNPDELINTSKVSRLMFHIGDNFIANGRLYPYDQRDANFQCNKEKYIPYRDTVAKLFSVELGKPLYKEDWNLCNYLYTSGHQYPDYAHYDRCAVTFVKNEVFNGHKLHIGKMPVCIECGKDVEDSGNLFCGSRRDRGCDGEERIRCARCRYSIDPGEEILIDGEYYCNDCIETCEGCGTTVSRNNARYIDVDDVYVCEDCYNDRYTTCSECTRSFNIDDAIIIDERIFCSSDCAESYGYIMVEGDYYPADEVCTCERCGERILAEEAEYAPDTNIYFCSESCGTAYGYTRTDNGDWRIE